MMKSHHHTYPRDYHHYHDYDQNQRSTPIDISGYNHDHGDDDSHEDKYDDDRTPTQRGHSEEMI